MTVDQIQNFLKAIPKRGAVELFDSEDFTFGMGGRVARRTATAKRRI